MVRRCPKCKTDLIVEVEGKYVKKIFWCDDCNYEWVIK